MKFIAAEIRSLASTTSFVSYFLLAGEVRIAVVYESPSGEDSLAPECFSPDLTSHDHRDPNLRE